MNLGTTVLLSMLLDEEEGEGEWLRAFSTVLSKRNTLELNSWFWTLIATMLLSVLVISHAANISLNEPIIEREWR